MDGAADTLAYGYDGSGQLLTVKRGATVVESHNYDGERQPARRRCGLRRSRPPDRRGGVAYTWDADGYLTGRGADTFAYSRDGGLLTATVGGATTTYAYDAFGRRTAAGSIEVPLRQPGEHVPGDAHRSTAPASSRPTTTTATTGCSPPSAAASATTSAPTRSARRGSWSAPPTARSCARSTYDAFGVETSVSGSFELPIGYAGGLRDAATGLVRFGAARLRPGRRALHRERPDVLPRQRGEPLHLRGQQPDHAEGPDGPGLRRLVDVRRRSAAASRSAATTSSTGAPTGRSASRAASAVAAASTSTSSAARRTPASRCSPRPRRRWAWSAARSAASSTSTA